MLTLALEHRLENEVKKSRFIAVVQRVDSPEEALSQLDLLREREATHNCFAYKVGDKYRFSDDGEPGGTAGRPILAAIEAQGVDHVLVVVIRYFGGTKLGAGGLARAYGGAAAECLRTAPKEEIVPMITGEIKVPFESIGVLYPILEKHKCTKLNEAFDENGLILTVELKQSESEIFLNSLGDATRGAGEFIVCSVGLGVA